MIIMTLLKLLSCIKEIINYEDSAPRHVIANFNERGLKEGYSILTFKKNSGSYKKIEFYNTDEDKYFMFIRYIISL